jgi:hypothetical protein
MSMQARHDGGSDLYGKRYFRHLASIHRELSTLVEKEVEKYVWVLSIISTTCSFV